MPNNTSHFHQSEQLKEKILILLYKVLKQISKIFLENLI